MGDVSDLLATATARLAGASDSPRLDAEILLGHVLGRSRTWLFTWGDRIPRAEEAGAFQALVARRAAGEPVAYLTGAREFWSLPLAVSPATLIPRPDTETLVAAALERTGRDAIRALDLGTGTGAIALALASERPHWHLVAVDREPAAVALAIRNRDNLELTRVEILQSDWFAAVSGRFDLIVSNPPYIDSADPHLQQGDVRHEPASALVAEDGGLADLAHIIVTAVEYLVPGGLLMVEHGADQGEAVRRLFTEQGYQAVESRRDLAALERVTFGTAPAADK
ncbi:MAG: peptide chain release factor N(5)-glutamine methyltransferase [Bacteroidales bacterium]|nr:peptide chain release factor N(5)-glutamine methyltransferase [Bacteroidales bacterium]